MDVILSMLSTSPMHVHLNVLFPSYTNSMEMNEWMKAFPIITNGQLLKTLFNKLPPDLFKRVKYKVDFQIGDYSYYFLLTSWSKLTTMTDVLLFGFLQVLSFSKATYLILIRIDIHQRMPQPATHLYLSSLLIDQWIGPDRCFIFGCSPNFCFLSLNEMVWIYRQWKEIKEKYRSYKVDDNLTSTQTTSRMLLVDSWWLEEL